MPLVPLSTSAATARIAKVAALRSLQGSLSIGSGPYLGNGPYNLRRLSRSELGKLIIVLAIEATIALGLLAFVSLGRWQLAPQTSIILAKGIFGGHDTLRRPPKF